MKFYSLEIRKITSHTLFPFQALNYLGIQPTKEQHQALREKMQVDPKGMVSFGGNVRFIMLHHHRNLVEELLWPTFIKSASSLAGKKEKQKPHLLICQVP